MQKANTPSDKIQSISHLLKYDGHAHSYSRCVYKKRHEDMTPWEDFLKMDLEGKLNVIKEGVAMIKLAAKSNGMIGQSITEHAHLFSQAGIPYQAYIKAIEKYVYDEYDDDIKSPKLYLGIELNMKHPSNCRSYLDINEMCVIGEKNHYEMLNKLDTIIASIHYRDIENQDSKTNKGYFNLVMSCIKELSDITKHISNSPALVIGHPWTAASILNASAYNRLLEQDPRMIFHYPDLTSYELSRNALIQYFSIEQLQQISQEMYLKKVMPEINLSYVEENRSDIRNTDDQHPKERPPISEAYISYCLSKNIRQVPISIGTDDHTRRKIGKIGKKKQILQKILDQVPSLPHAVSWMSIKE